MTPISARRHQRRSRSPLWWLAVALWATLGLALGAYAVRNHDVAPASATVDNEKAVGTITRTSEPSTSVLGGRSQGEISGATTSESGEPELAPASSADRGGQAWVEAGPSSDFRAPSHGWGSHAASCPTDTFLVYGARTEPRKYEYVVCSAPDGELLYHGVDVDSGADIRLRACAEEGGVYVAEASADYRYVVADRRPQPWESSGVAGYAPSVSAITLYKSETDVDWQYGVASEWGMQNLPTEFVKC